MIEIIPAIDLIEGKCVRLTQGAYESKKIYNEDPLEVAKMFEDYGIRRLHMVDLDGAKSSHIVNTKVLERIATGTRLTLDFGGGIKSDDDVRIAFECGAQMITVGSIAVKDENKFLTWLRTYGAERIILGADVKDRHISVNGWKEDSSLVLDDFLRHYTSEGINQILCTDISKDGMLQGPSIELYKDIMAQHKDINLIASGGVSCVHDIEMLEEAGIPSVVFGKAIYEGRIGMNELERWI